jgi:hypothetical protein
MEYLWKLVRTVLVVLVLAIVLTLPACPTPDPGDDDDSAEAALIVIEEDAYAVMECTHPAYGELAGSLRCSYLGVTEHTYAGGITYYTVDMSQCDLPVLGNGWECTGRFFATAPID